MTKTATGLSENPNSTDELVRDIEESGYPVGRLRALGKKYVDMPHVSNNPTPKLRKAPQPPLSHSGAHADSDRAKKPALVEPSGAGRDLSPGDRVDGLGDFGMPTGEFGTVRQVNEDEALVKWDDDGRMRLHQQ